MKIAIFFASLILVTAANAGGVIYGPFSQWQYVDSSHIIVSSGSRKAIVKLGGCFVNQASQVRVLSNELMSYSGKLLIDSQVCDVWQIDVF